MFTFNGKIPDIVTYAGKDVKTVKYNGITVWEKNTQPETWVLNLDLTNSIGSDDTFRELYFTADGVFFTSISILTSGAEKLLKFDEITPYSTANNKWAEVGYRTLIFSVPPTGKLKTWLQNNGVKQ